MRPTSVKKPEAQDQTQYLCHVYIQDLGFQASLLSLISLSSAASLSWCSLSLSASSLAMLTRWHGPRVPNGKGRVSALPPQHEEAADPSPMLALGGRATRRQRARSRLIHVR